jgi:hypothetical protein
MIHRKVILVAILALAVLGAVGSTSADAAPSAAWKLTVNPSPTNFAPGSSPRYLVVATNVGAAPTSGPVSVKTTLPEELTALSVEGTSGDPSASVDPECTFTAHNVTCATKGEATEALHPGRLFIISIQVSVPIGSNEKTLDTKASVQGGGAADEVTTSFPTLISSSSPSFGFLPGFSTPLTNEDGSATTLAGAHPYQLTVDFGFPTENPGDGLTGAGHPRDLVTNLPRGLLGNPAATPVLCTEADLISEVAPGCPDASQVGVINVTTLALDEGLVTPETSDLYSVVPPPGSPAAFAFNAAGVGIFIHLIAGIRSDGDYGAFTVSNDVLALGSNPIFSVQAQLWGKPSDAAHDQTRGKCLFSGVFCSVEPQETSFLTMPGDCPGTPIVTEARADSWEESGPEHERTASYGSADLLGSPIHVEGCDALEFKPTIKVSPTTNFTDSPSGLDVDLSQPQDFDFKGRASADLKDATVVFPPGMTVNPSQAGGLDACSAAQIGLKTAIGASPIHFSKTPQSCPDAAKLGSVEVTSPLLAQYDAEHEVERDAEGNPIPEPLHGSVYIAKPYENPFNSLIAVYFAIEDPRTGIVAKLAGKAEPDPLTGQLKTRFTENPELPLEDVRVHLFDGPRAPLITPPTCPPNVTNTTTARLTPWSAPEAPDVFTDDAFASSAAPGGGPCPGSEAQMPNAPSLNAGMISTAAGAFSPLVFKLAREDGSQRLAKIEATLPPGLSARLAGVATCGEAQIAKAQSRERANQGALERTDPSCPASSEVGVVNVGAGAGPSPYYARGHAYLSGPYRGAPLSLAIITPAIAGPFDLGAVVVRTALYIDPTTAQGRAVSDPLPTVLEGIPLDVRSVALQMSRPRFTFNPTSCDPTAFTGAVTSALGSVAALSHRFQVGGCPSLPYRPKIHTRLFGSIHRGGNPRLRTVFEARPGEANTARIVFALPHSEFIDQAHFRTICTRVQFAAGQCPAGSIYGWVKAISPQVDYTLEGPIYLRSSSNQLPDVVVALRGPPSQPIEIDLTGKVDSVNGGIRTSFAVVPDAPVTKAIVTLRGGKKGLFQNSTNICEGTHRASVKLDGQNGKPHDLHPVLKADCARKQEKRR